SQEIVHQMASKIGKPSKLFRWIKSQSRSFQNYSRRAQNFFKHANRDPNDTLLYQPRLAEIHMFDAVSCFGELGRLTPLMATFALRFSISYADVLDPKDFPVNLSQGLDISTLGKMSRQVFLETVFPFFESRWG